MPLLANVRIVSLPQVSGQYSCPRGVDVRTHQLRYLLPAVLSAIVVPALLMPDGSTIIIGLTNLGLLAAVLAALVKWQLVTGN
jgi:branched-subunit amino acid transport protein